MIGRQGINQIIRLMHAIVKEELLRFSRGSGGMGAPPVPPEVMKSHPLDPDTGPHTGALTEDDVVFDDAAGHDHQGAGDTGKKVTAAKVVNVPAGGISATDVQAAIDELDSEKASTPLAEADVIFDDAAGHDHQGAGDTGKKIAAAKVTNVPAGGISATDVQAAIDELDAEKAGAAETAAAKHIHAYKEDKSAECDGVKVTFITAQQFEPYTLRVFHERLEQLDGMVDYAEGAMYDHFDMVAAPNPGDKLIAHYLAQRV